MFAGVKQSLERGLAFGAIGGLGGVFLFVGLGFVSHALWVILARAYDAVLASQVLGGFYLALSGICFLMLRGKVDKSAPKSMAMPEHAGGGTPDPLMGVAQAFVQGVEAGKAAGHRA